MEGISNRALSEFVTCVVAAVSEQLDVPRLMEALGKQHALYSAQAGETPQAIAQQLREVGSALAQIQALRSKRGRPPH